MGDLPDDERRHPARREADGQLDHWRGSMDELVRAHERRLGAHAETLRDLERQVTTMRSEFAEVRTTLREVQSDLSEMRQEDMHELRAAITAARESTRSVILYLIAPLLVAVIAGLVLFALTGHSH